MIKCNPQCGEFKLLITTSSEAWLVLRGCLPCLSPLLLVLCVGQLGLEGLLGKQSLDFLFFFFHADIPALRSVLLIPAGGCVDQLLFPTAAFFPFLSVPGSLQLQGHISLQKEL